MSGAVVVGESRVDKPGTPIAPDAALRVRGRGHDYVGRGALKLLQALNVFEIPVAGRVCLDLGASTGGFTQVLLERGAVRVYAVDVGRDQLAWLLRGDPRVISLEQTHARDLGPSRVPEAIELMVADVSFISLRQALLVPLTLLAPAGELVALVKPQFEALAAEVEAGGLVHDAAVRDRTCREVADFLVAHGFEVRGPVPCEVLGATGNQEYLLAATRR